VVIVSLVGWSAVTLLSGLVRNDWQLVVLRVLLAVAQVCYMPVGQALLAEFHGPESRGRASGFFQSGSSLGIFLAGFPVAWLANRLGWRNMLILCGSLGLVYSLVMWRYLPSPPVRQSGQTGPPISVHQAAALLRIPSILAMMAMFAMTSMAYWVLFSYLPLFVYEQYHLSLEAAAFQATFYIQISAVLVMPLYATVSDRWSTRDARNRYLACGLASTLGLPALVTIGNGSHIIVLTAGLLLFGLAMASSDASWLAMLCNVTSSRQRATAYGLLNCCGTLAGGFAAFATALLMKRLGLGFLIALLGSMYILISLLMIACGYWLLKRDQQQAP
jgi:predicted MFS family arabinose efflux permease